jgi:prepilin-type N-terminal cleavage/methylation domain-containing protein
MKNFLSKTNKHTQLAAKSTGGSRGFTLIEMIIAVGLFAVVMTTALGIILSFIEDNKKSQAINSVVNNVNFAIDSMIRDIKTGYHYEQGTTIPATNSVTLISTLYSSSDFDDDVDEKQVTYRYNTNVGDANYHKLEKQVCPSSGPGTFSCSGIGFLPITSSDVDIERVSFYVDPGSPKVRQPSVFMTIEGTSKVNTNGAADFSIQTLIAQRLLNI